MVGLLAVELFQTRDGRLLVNELAMRPHNSGHWTIDGARTSQFEQHLRAVLNLPLGSPVMTAPALSWRMCSVALTPTCTAKLNHVMAADTAVKVQLYGKPVRPGRKVGHVTAPGPASPRPATGPGGRRATWPPDPRMRRTTVMPGRGPVRRGCSGGRATERGECG